MAVVGVEGASLLGAGVVGDRDVRARVVGACIEGSGVVVVGVEGASVLLVGIVGGRVVGARVIEAALRDFLWRGRC